MLLYIAFLLLCLAQLVHFSNHWYLLSLRLSENAKMARMRRAVDWNTEPRPRRAPKSGALKKLGF
ncbi:hypothetical protein [Actibacterium ureilyticum]|uniref:hypothetical protein n=1 Tax=Actibacterium ureilyticum TaxID=1590614 RepID=UPI000BAACA21|nr:hypothetical protein [Actibacterium ureilyticum]